IELLNMFGGGQVECVRSNEIIAKLIAQTFRQSGVNVVYHELLDFAGDELYFYQHGGKLRGKTYRDTLFMFERSCVFGLYQESGSFELNPAMDTIVGDGDSV